MHTRPTALALSVLALSLTACASHAPKTEARDGAGALAELSSDQFAIHDTRAARRLTLAQLADRAAEADVVLVGELHSHPVGLALASRLWDAVLDRRPDAVLSMEFFERDQQVALDDYLAGVTDEEAFREAARKTTASSYPPGRRAMIESAKDAGRPVIAANAPRRYASLARTDGLDRYDDLTPEQRRLVTPPASIRDSAYRDRFLDLMSGMTGHGGGQEMTEAQAREMGESFFRAQAVWDATMGESIARATALGAPVVHVVGRFHVERPREGGGLAQQLRDRLPGARLLVIVMHDAPPGPLDNDLRALGDVVVLVGDSDAGSL